MLVIHKTFMICCIQPATPGYCSFLSITNIQGSNYFLIEYKIDLEMLATKKKIKMMYIYTYIFFQVSPLFAIICYEYKHSIVISQ